MKNINNLRQLLHSGVNNLYNNYPQIDKLNVFPVPDGDTGTNMNLTCTNGYAEIDKKIEFNSLKELLFKFSRGLIMGARGNSGVIFSQIIKGFYLGLEDDIQEITPVIWKKCLGLAAETAYKAVMKPVEGTILTVIRETYEKSLELDDNMSNKEFWSNIIKIANLSLENTPNLLPALKEVGVVDSGGFGLVKFFEGISYFYANNKVVEKLKKLEENTGSNVNINIDDSEFGYCTEAIVMLDEPLIKELKIEIVRSKLEEFGNNSIVAVKDEDILKIHTHALQPGQVLTFLQQLGEFRTIKVENMSLQADSHVVGGNPNAKKNHKEKKFIFEKARTLENNFASIVVVPTVEMGEYFTDELNASFAINAGDKMNPSTKDFMNAIEEVDAKNVYIFPNDSNVFLTARQAKELEKKSKVYVLPTKTIAQGVNALINFDGDEKASKIEADIAKSIKNVVTYAITRASKDAKIDGVQVEEGNYIGIADKKIVYAGLSIVDVMSKSFVKFLNAKTEILTIFKGKNANMKDLLFLRKLLDENYDVEYEIVNSEQEVYDFIIGIE